MDAHVALDGGIITGHGKVHDAALDQRIFDGIRDAVALPVNRH